MRVLLLLVGVLSLPTFACQLTPNGMENCAPQKGHLPSEIMKMIAERESLSDSESSLQTLNSMLVWGQERREAAPFASEFFTSQYPDAWGEVTP